MYIFVYVKVLFEAVVVKILCVHLVCRWLKAMLESSQLMVQEYDNPKLVTYLEHAARAGTPLLITVSHHGCVASANGRLSCHYIMYQGVPEELSSVLDPFLQTNFSDNSGDKNFIKIGKTEFEYNPSFR